MTRGNGEGEAIKNVRKKERKEKVSGSPGVSSDQSALLKTRVQKKNKKKDLIPRKHRQGFNGANDEEGYNLRGKNREGSSASGGELNFREAGTSGSQHKSI